jgi:hypothetical protein
MLLLYLITVCCALVLIGAAVGIRRAIVSHNHKAAPASHDENISIRS